jgi:hypothetical protein
MIYPSSDVPGSDFPHPIIATFWRGQLSSVDGFHLGGVAKWNVKEAEDNKKFNIYSEFKQKFSI